MRSAVAMKTCSHWTGAGEQAAVVADQRERERRARRGAECELQRPGIGCVEDTEPVKTRRDIEIRTMRAVDEEVVAEKAVHQVLGRGGVVDAGAPVLQHQRNLGAAWRQVERGAQCAFVVVLDQDDAIQAAIGLSRSPCRADAGDTSTCRRDSRTSKS